VKRAVQPSVATGAPWSRVTAHGYDGSVPGDHHRSPAGRLRSCRSYDAGQINPSAHAPRQAVACGSARQSAEERFELSFAFGGLGAVRHACLHQLTGGGLIDEGGPAVVLLLQTGGEIGGRDRRFGGGDDAVGQRGNGVGQAVDERGELVGRQRAVDPPVLCGGASGALVPRRTRRVASGGLRLRDAAAELDDAVRIGESGKGRGSRPVVCATRARR
jgi:hypothetical protein